MELNILNLIADIQCNNLSVPDNGNMSCPSGKVYTGDACSFTCITGYELTGNDTRTCQSDGSWNGSDNFCLRGKFCLHIVKILHSRYSYQIFSVLCISR